MSIRTEGSTVFEDTVACISAIFDGIVGVYSIDSNNVFVRDGDRYPDQNIHDFSFRRFKISVDLDLHGTDDIDFGTGVINYGPDIIENEKNIFECGIAFFIGEN